MVEAAIARFRGIDIVVHNASSGASAHPVAFADLAIESWNERAVVALCEPGGRCITGRTICVDGGIFTAH